MTAANPCTAVCVNTGAPVEMDWSEDVGALLQIWFGGQEMAGALADVLLEMPSPEVVCRLVFQFV